MSACMRSCDGLVVCASHAMYLCMYITVCIVLYMYSVCIFAESAHLTEKREHSETYPLSDRWQKILPHFNGLDKSGRIQSSHRTYYHWTLRGWSLAFQQGATCENRPNIEPKSSWNSTVTLFGSTIFHGTISTASAAIMENQLWSLGEHEKEHGLKECVEGFCKNRLRRGPNIQELRKIDTLENWIFFRFHGWNSGRENKYSLKLSVVF